MNKHPLVSIVIPFYNEEGAVFGFHKALTKALKSLSQFEFEFICVNDGSSDNTLNELLECVAKDPRYLVLELSRNFGKEAAMSAGIDKAQGDCIKILLI
jgi:glycosyltransferase involved in cell wall biosynthesis